MISSDAYPARSYAWLVVAILIATAVLSFTDRQVLSLLVDPIRAEFSISDAQMSLLLGISFALVYGAAGIPVGILADRYSRRNLIVAGVLVWSAGTIACGLSHDFLQLFSSRVIVGLGEGALAPSAISLISDYFPPQRRGLAVALFLSGIAMGSGVAILIGGAVLRLIETHAAHGNWLGFYAPWRMVFLLIGCPGILWAAIILQIREPSRRATDAAALGGAPVSSSMSGRFGITAFSPRIALLKRVAPIYISIAAASFVDNAIGAWGPTLLIRSFSKDPAQIGLQLGALLTIGFGGGVLIGGALADRCSSNGGWRRKLHVSLWVSLVILPTSLMLNATSFGWVMGGIPGYYVLSGIVTAVGFSAILDAIPGESRGLAMSIAFFLNVALGAGLGPTAVSVAGKYIFGLEAGLGPPLVATACFGFLVSVAALGFGLGTSRESQYTHA